MGARRHQRSTIVARATRLVRNLPQTRRAGHNQWAHGNGGAMPLAERIYRRTNRLYDRARSPAAIQAAHLQPVAGIDHLRGHRYCVLVSYRRDGTAVVSPLWFGLGDGRLYVRTGAATAKLQRIRRNAEVRIAPSSVRGAPLGPPAAHYLEIVPVDGSGRDGA